MNKYFLNNNNYNKNNNNNNNNNNNYNRVMMIIKLVLYNRLFCLKFFPNHFNNTLMEKNSFPIFIGYFNLSPTLFVFMNILFVFYF